MDLTRTMIAQLQIATIEYGEMTITWTDDSSVECLLNLMFHFHETYPDSFFTDKPLLIPSKEEEGISLH